MPFSHEDRACVSGASACEVPLKSSAQGLVEAPPGTSHLYAQFRLMSWPTQELPDVDCLFFRHSRSLVCVYKNPGRSHLWSALLPIITGLRMGLNRSVLTVGVYYRKDVEVVLVEETLDLGGRGKVCEQVVRHILDDLYFSIRAAHPRCFWGMI